MLDWTGPLSGMWYSSGRQPMAVTAPQASVASARHMPSAASEACSDQQQQKKTLQLKKIISQNVNRCVCFYFKK